MKTLALEWVDKAEGDYAIMEREGRVRRQSSYDGICFHAQQCAEKYLKARLTEANIEFGKYMTSLRYWTACYRRSRFGKNFAEICGLSLRLCRCFSIPRRFCQPRTSQGCD